ncbi:MAG TPA: ABC transporter permease [Terracidiphilus sp.]|nr:ABC transporter permease [Terracidiphilus sp.]
MHQLWKDIRYSLRQLRGSPGFSITAIVTLALGIGANSAIFSLVHSVLLRSLPVGDPAQLYRIGDKGQCCVDGGFPEDAAQTGDFSIFSYDLYKHFQASAPEFEQLAAAQAGEEAMSVRRGRNLPKSLGTEFVSGNYFSTLGLSPYAGRLFADSDDTPAASPVVVLSYATWKAEFSGDPSVVGSTIYIQTHPFTVAGIAPPGFFGDRETDTPPSIWLPLNTEPYLHGPTSILHHTSSNWLYPIGRIRTGTSIPALQDKLSVALRQWLPTQPLFTANGGAAVIPKQHVVLTPAGGGIQTLQQQVGRGLTMLMILAGVVLLIACANIANLLMARSTARRGDMAVRMALGADRRRVIRQILTESVLLSFLGGVAGLGVAYASTKMILALAFQDAKNLPFSANPSPEVLGFTFAVALLTGVLFGLAPAWVSSHSQPAEVLKGVNRSTHDHSTLPQKALVVFQAALSLVLLASAILMSRSLAKMEHQNFGVSTESRYVVHFNTAGAGYTAETAPALYRQIEDRFGSLPGVASVGLALYSPLEGDNWGECVIQQGHGAPGPNSNCGSTWDRVNPQFLDSVGVPVIQGRNFSAQDTGSSPAVALVNQTFVKRFFPNQNPVGQHFGIDFPQYSGSFQIVGVFRDFKMNSPRRQVRPVFLRPLTQHFMGYAEPELNSGETQSMLIESMILRFDRPQQDVEPLVRKTLASIDPNLTVRDLRTFEDQVTGNFTEDRLVARLTTLFGILALILASVGLYGVMSYLVVRRTGEIGVRMALGATRSSVVSMVLRGALLQIVAGLVLGIPCALLAGHLMASQLYGVSQYDPWALAGAVGALGICATLAGLIPSRRAASIEPMRALRME